MISKEPKAAGVDGAPAAMAAVAMEVAAAMVVATEAVTEAAMEVVALCSFRPARVGRRLAVGARVFLVDQDGIREAPAGILVVPDGIREVLVGIREDPAGTKEDPVGTKVVREAMEAVGQTVEEATLSRTAMLTL